MEQQILSHIRTHLICKIYNPLHAVQEFYGWTSSSSIRSKQSPVVSWFVFVSTQQSFNEWFVFC